MARDNSPQERQQKQLARKQGRRASYDRILIVSEGSKTEPNYFREIRAAYRLHTANVEVRPSELGTAPIQVVQPNYTFRMQRLQAFKFELMPDGRQEWQMRRFAGSCRFVFNQALALQQANRQDGGKFIGYVAMAKYLTAWRNSSATAWLADAPVHPQQQALKDLERAYQNFFAKRSKFPRFKRHGDRASFRYPDPKQIKFDAANARIFLPKLGWLRLRLSRSVLGEIKSVTVSGSCGRWHASILTQREVEQPVPQGTAAVGIDMGVARFATMSDGTFIAPLASFKRHEARLRRYQRAMSRKRKGARNWHKARGKVQRLHARIANVRQDFRQQRDRAGPCPGSGRRPAGQEHERLGQGHSTAARQERLGQGEPEQGHPGPGLGGVPPPARIQAGLGRRRADRRRSQEHQQDMPRVRSCRCTEPPDASRLPVRGLWPPGPCRCGGGDQHTGAGAPRSSLWRGRQSRKARDRKVEGQACSLSEAGTHRGDHGRLCLLWRSRNPLPLGRGGCQGEALDLQVQ